MASSSVENLVTAWYKGFEKPFDNQFSEQDFLTVFHPDIEWFDHAFHVRRVGHAAVLGLRQSFLHCNQPFRSELKVSMSDISTCIYLATLGGDLI